MQSNGQRQRDRRDVGGPLGLHCEARGTPAYSQTRTRRAASSLNSIALLRSELQHSIAHRMTPSIRRDELGAVYLWRLT